MSPEILKGKGYSFSCDFWSIGIVSYEIFYKCVPFGNNAKEVMEIYNDIMYNNKLYIIFNVLYFFVSYFISINIGKWCIYESINYFFH